MEVDIPDLNDLEFEEQCDCMKPHQDPRAAKNTIKFIYPDHPDHNCPDCLGSGYMLNAVGKRLFATLLKFKAI